MKFLLSIFVVSFLLTSAYSSFSQPVHDLMERKDTSKGEKLFKSNCSGCHLNGQNLIKADKPIIGSLKLKSKGVLKKFLESPPQPMPKYDNITSMDAQFDSLYEYLIMLMGK